MKTIALTLALSLWLTPVEAVEIAAKSSTAELRSSSILKTAERLALLPEGRTIDVFIKYREPPTPTLRREGRSSTIMGRVAQRSNRIEAASKTISERLSNAGVPIERVYRHQPLMTASVNADALRILADDPEVEAVFNVGVRRPGQVLEPQPEGKSLTFTVGDIDASDAWALGYEGQGQVVAVLDTGVFVDHQMLAGKVREELCFSGGLSGSQSLCPSGASSAVGAGAASALCDATTSVCSHGTHVSGIAVGSYTGASSSIHGVARRSDLIAMQVFSQGSGFGVCGESGGTCLLASDADIIAGLEWVISNASNYNFAAVNLSLGGGGFSDFCDAISAYTSPINTLRELGIATVVASGNDFSVGSVSTPACIENAITVSSVFITTPSAFGNNAPMVDFLAPGEDVQSAGIGESTYFISDGTSMAAPHVAGAIAVLRSAQPTATLDEIEHAFDLTGNYVSMPSWTWETPIIDVDDAIGALGTTPPPLGTGVVAVQRSDAEDVQSYLRLYNPTSSSGTATVQFIHDGNGSQLGSATYTVPAQGSLQLFAGDLETAMGINPADVAPDSYSAYVDSTYAGYVQHVLWNVTGASLSNVTSCTNGYADYQGHAGNIHTSEVAPGYPSFLAFHNSGTTSETLELDIYDSLTGQYVGGVFTTEPVIPNTTGFFLMEDILEVIEFVPETAQYHLNVHITPTEFEGTITHLVINLGSGLTTDMSMKCDTR